MIKHKKSLTALIIILILVFLFIGNASDEREYCTTTNLYSKQYGDAYDLDYTSCYKRKSTLGSHIMPLMCFDACPYVTKYTHEYFLNNKKLQNNFPDFSAGYRIGKYILADDDRLISIDANGVLQDFGSLNLNTIQRDILAIIDGKVYALGSEPQALYEHDIKSNKTNKIADFKIPVNDLYSRLYDSFITIDNESHDYLLHFQTITYQDNTSSSGKRFYTEYTYNIRQKELQMDRSQAINEIITDEQSYDGRKAWGVWQMNGNNEDGPAEKLGLKYQFDWSYDYYGFFR